MTIVLTGLAALGLGYAIGVLQGGIHIYKDAKQSKADELKHNEAVVPHEYQQYFDQNDGIIK